MTAAAAALDVESLYGDLSRPLARIVGHGAGPGAPVEDACQSAWNRLLRRQDAIDRNCVLGWLAATAMHEASRLRMRDARELSLEAFVQEQQEAEVVDVRLQEAGPDPHETAEARELLASVRSLPERQRLLLWLRACGFSYEEIEARTGASKRTIDRQLTRARARIRASRW